MNSTHNLNDLFDQLGLPSADEKIDLFIEKKKGLLPSTKLAEASFWTSHQSAFLSEATAEDADWAQVVDELDSLLRQ